MIQVKSRSFLTSSDEQKVKVMLVEGYPPKYISAIVGCSLSSIYKRSKFINGVSSPRHLWTDEEDEAVVRMWSEGMKSKQIAEHFNVSKNSVDSRIYVLRSRGEYFESRIHVQKNFKKQIQL